MGLKKGIIIDLVMLASLGVFGIIYLTMQETRSIQSGKPIPTLSPAVAKTITPATASALANPASVNCKNVGGTLVIQKRGDGGEYGLCQFGDNQACEEWALYRKECPVGGVKTTGYDNIEQDYCAWIGGKTIAEPNASCTLPSGKMCSDKALYNGTCPQGS